MKLIDTHTHFDVEVFDIDRVYQAQKAYQAGVRHLVLIGFMARYFAQMVQCQNTMLGLIQNQAQSPMAHLAFGLHPCYIQNHSLADLDSLVHYIDKNPSVAIGEIGLDTFTKPLKQPDILQKQKHFFAAQLDIAKAHKLPVLLHIRKAHGAVLSILKASRFDYGGIAHSFSGGIQEARALVDLGFKIGITGQITNPNAKKLRSTIQALTQDIGARHLVIETDCPDFTPLMCHDTHGRRNVPANLIFVLDTLAEFLSIPRADLAKTLWYNSLSVLANIQDTYE